MRVEYEDQELERLATDETYRPKRMHIDLVRAYRKTIGLLAAAQTQKDLAAMRGLRLEKLSGARRGQYSLRVNDQWRIVARFKPDPAGQAIIVIELIDYH